MIAPKAKLLLICTLLMGFASLAIASKQSNSMDPVLRGQRLKKPSLEVKTPEKIKVVEQKQKIPTKKSSSYTLSAKLIRGAKTTPSIEFKTEELDLPLAHESLDFNITEKLNEAQTLAPIGEGGW